MEENYSYTEYNEEKNRIPWLRIFISFLILIVGVIIVLLLLKACNKPVLKDDLIEAAKDYYEKYPEYLPIEVGVCYNVTLDELEKEGLIKISDYETCDKYNTYVTVCYLESKTYHYSANLDCEVEDTDYGIWQDGDESDLTDESDVRYTFLGEEMQTGEKYYYPNDLTDPTKVIEYYASIPKSGYSGTEDQQIGYKWYTQKTVNSYWNNGGYSSTQPEGYSTKGSSKTVTNYSTTKPSSASYRKITEVKLYRYEEVARPYKCKCADPEGKLPGATIATTICALRDDGYTKPVDIYYTCDGTKQVDRGTVCKKMSDWSSKACKSSTINGINCETQTGYQYTDTMWKWYNVTTQKSYYPSGSSDASKENTYYVSAPVSGAQKDESTQATVYKYYKIEKGTIGGSIEEWLPITNGYVTYDEMMEAFRTLGYDVYSLSDIDKIENIRYQYKMQYRELEG